jgi:hypothetical protein
MSIRQPVSPSVARVETLGSHWMDFDEIWSETFRKSVEKI